MDTIELMKIVTPVLCAFLLMFGSRTAIELSVAEHPGAAETGYKLPEPAAEPKPAAGDAPPAAGGFSAAAVLGLLPKASAENGKSNFSKCQACHNIDKGGANAVGPNLWSVVGRKIAGHQGFAYSDGLKAKGGDWTFENLANFLHNPKAFAPGTKMTFAGIPDAAQLADVLAYLRGQADSPAPMPPTR